MAITDNILATYGPDEATYKSNLGGDDHVNEEAIYSATEDIDAAKFNKHAKALAELLARLRHGNLLTIPFELSSTPGTATTAVPRMGSTATGWLAHVDGTVVGITAQFDSALSAGSAVVTPKVGGVDCALTLTLGAGVSSGRARQLPSSADATDGIDASELETLAVDVVTSGATWAGADRLVVDVIISCGEEEGI